MENLCADVRVNGVKPASRFSCLSFAPRHSRLLHHQRPLMGTGIETPGRRRRVECVTFRYRKVSQIWLNLIGKTVRLNEHNLVVICVVGMCIFCSRSIISPPPPKKKSKYVLSMWVQIDLFCHTSAGALLPRIRCISVTADRPEKTLERGLSVVPSQLVVF